MSVNKYLSHLMVLPEDDADRQLANGFQSDPLLDTRRMQILPVAGGWLEVLERFKRDHIPDMERYTHRFLVLLIDFDGKGDRLAAAKTEIPEHLKERVFVLGAWSEPEELRRNLGSYETVGSTLAGECRENTAATWDHPLLCHNAGELERLRKDVRAFLFTGFR